MFKDSIAQSINQWLDAYLEEDVVTETPRLFGILPQVWHGCHIVRRGTAGGIRSVGTDFPLFPDKAQ